MGRRQAFNRVVTGGDERAVDAELAGYFEVVEGVPDEEDRGGRNRELADEIAAERDLAVGVDVVEARDVVEVGGKSEVGYDFVEGFMAIGRQDRLLTAGRLHGPENQPALPMESRIEAAGFVAGDKFHAELLKTIDLRIEAEALVVFAHGEIEELVVTCPRQSR